jgi:AcrR family transcriptional regulator
LAQASKGAVYHHFRDKQAIFAELFRTSKESVTSKVIEAMPAESEEPWEKVKTAIRLFLHGYVADDDARELLRQVVSVLGWDRVRELNEQQTLPFLRATFESFVANGYARPVPVEATVELFFARFYNGVLFITDAEDPDTASNEVEAVILVHSRDSSRHGRRCPDVVERMTIPGDAREIERGCGTAQ